MRNKLWLLAVGLAVFIAFASAMAEEVGKEKVIEIAKVAAKAEGINLEGVTIVYDEGGKLWSETLGAAAVLDNSPNYGILKNGFLKNYRIVLFDFVDPAKDVWVFVDKDTGEVLEVYQVP
ncbi:MAG: hypothetical protein ACOY3D_05090 [Candidatus Omnitrophota bacterium]